MVISVEELVEGLRTRYKDVECAVACVSGGIDSTVSAIIARMALGDRVYPVFIDTGFMRLGEGQAVKRALAGLLDVELYDFSEDVVSSIEGLSDAEEKRKAFRDAFYRAVKRIADEKGCSWVVQGTIKADIVETVGGVKTQHNVLNEELMRRYGLRVIEPVADLYKHEVRELARALGLPEHLIARQPFPGPGLLVRAVGRLHREKLELVRWANAIVEELLGHEGFSQYFAAAWEYEVAGGGAVEGLGEYVVFTVGVTGVLQGSRTYGRPVLVKAPHLTEALFEVYKRFNALEHPHVLVELAERGRGDYLVAVRAVASKDFITAEVPRVSAGLLRAVAKRLINVPGVRAVAFDVTPKPPATIEYE